MLRTEMSDDATQNFHLKNKNENYIARRMHTNQFSSQNEIIKKSILFNLFCLFEFMKIMFKFKFSI